MIIDDFSKTTKVIGEDWGLEDVKVYAGAEYAGAEDMRIILMAHKPNGYPPSYEQGRRNFQ